MTVPVIKVFGVPETLQAFQELPRRMRLRHMRIALNAGGGVIRDAARPYVPRETGLLAKSLAVKVKIPQASYNVQHHAKPSYALIGPKRRAGKFMVRSKSGKLRGFGKGMRELRTQRTQLEAAGLRGLAREREAVRFVKASFPEAYYRNPSRYAHLAHRKVPYLTLAVQIAGASASAKMLDKLRQGLEQESRSLYAKQLARVG